MLRIPTALRSDGGFSGFVLAERSEDGPAQRLAGHLRRAGVDALVVIGARRRRLRGSHRP